MELKEYVESLGDISARKAFAQGVGTSYDYLKHLMHGRRDVSTNMAINLERESDGVLRCEELCPDSDWEFIRNTKVKKSA